MRLTLILLTAVTVAVRVPRVQAEAGETASAMPKVELIKEETISERKLVRYEHGSLAEWKYATPQRDYFYVEHPKKPLGGKAPLRVVLHSAGGGGQSEMAQNLTPARAHIIQAYVDYSSYGLFLDCRANQPVDWWWGHHSILKMPDLYTKELCPTEKRLLATVKWAMRTFPIDPNRVYLSGISMGGSGSLGLGMCHGDVFAAISVDVPAGADHALFRLRNGEHPDAPPVFNFSAQNDRWSKGQEQLIAYCQTNRHALAIAWGPFGHTSDASVFDAGVYEFPWLSIRKDEAYPVFTGASTDNNYPGFQNVTAPDQKGQINGYFRWKNITDTAGSFAMELRLEKKTELHKPAEPPVSATADVTLRRLQRFEVHPGKSYRWRFVAGETPAQSGIVSAAGDRLLTIPKLKIADTPGQLELTPN